MLDLSEASLFCQFIGWSRSGTTLVGSVLNSHPDITIAHETDVSMLVADGASRADILTAIAEHDAQFASIGRRWNGYDYLLPAHDQTATKTPRVIGDKKAGGTTEVELVAPGTLARVAETVGLPLRLLCVQRNPLDAIPTIARHLVEDTPPWYTALGEPLDAATDWYLLLAAEVQRVIDSGEFPVHLLSLEQLTAEPTATIASVLDFLDVAASSEYLRESAMAVAPGATRHRDDVSWNPTTRARLVDAIDSLPILSVYAE